MSDNLENEMIFQQSMNIFLDANCFVDKEQTLNTQKCCIVVLTFGYKRHLSEDAISDLLKQLIYLYLMLFHLQVGKSSTIKTIVRLPAKYFLL